jgi:hypothetical protein
VFTARYALSPYIKQIRFVFKGLKTLELPDENDYVVPLRLRYARVHSFLASNPLGGQFQTTSSAPQRIQSFCPQFEDTGLFYAPYPSDELQMMRHKIYHRPAVTLNVKARYIAAVTKLHETTTKLCQTDFTPLKKSANMTVC